MIARAASSPRSALFPVLGLALLIPSLALAQEEETFTVEETTAPPAETAPAETTAETVTDVTDSAVEDEGEGKPEKAPAKLGEARVSWQDIVVVKHKPFLKMNRLELMPTFGMTLNDNMIRHYGAIAEINYYLTDVLAVGVEGQYFTSEFRDTYDLVALQDRRLPTLNKYLYGAALNFFYTPIYAKFAVFNKRIVHLEWLLNIGVGFTESEVIPRDPALEPWKNFLLTPNVGLTMHVFLAKWITLNLGVKDYIFLDKYEAQDRHEADPELAKENADTALVNHVMFQAGASFWFPTSFRYSTFR